MAVCLICALDAADAPPPPRVARPVLPPPQVPPSTSVSTSSSPVPSSIGTEAATGALTDSGIGNLLAREFGVIPTKSGEIRKTIIATSKSALKISFIGGGTVVQKIFKNEAEFEHEYETYKQDSNVISQYLSEKSDYLKTNPDVKLPILVKILAFQKIDKTQYLDVLKNTLKLDQETINRIMAQETFKNIDTIYIEYMEAAKGKSLAGYLDDIEKGRLTKESAVQIFENIGREIGNSNRMLNVKKITNKKLTQDSFYRTLFHPDSHGGNFTYDEEMDQLYWIDLSGIKLLNINESKGFQDGTELSTYFFASEMIQKIVYLWGKTKAPNSSPEDRVMWINRALIAVYAHQALFNGYKTVVNQYKPQKLTMEFVLKNNTSYIKYPNFLGYIKKVESAYKELTGKEINLLEGYGITNVPPTQNR
jgi:hypothetical protein